MSTPPEQCVILNLPERTGTYTSPLTATAGR